MNIHRPIYYLLAIITSTCVMMISACNNNPRYKGLPNYSFKKTETRITLPEDMNEISGMSYYAGDRSIFAESDEQGFLYKIPLDKPRNIKRWKFDKKRDYEDIVLLDSTFYILTSKGEIVEVRFNEGDSISSVKHDFPFSGQNEFEAVYYEPQLKKLMIVCKECEQDAKTDNTVYSFDPATKTYEKAFVIDGKKVLEVSETGSSHFKPAGVAVHPITGELYMLSSVNKVIAIADRKGKIKEVYRLNPKMFYHPEGITFNPAGGLYLSNEAEDPHPANILYFEYKKEVKE